MAKLERKFHKRYTLWVSEGEAKQIEEQAWPGFLFPNVSGGAASAAGPWWHKRT